MNAPSPLYKMLWRRVGIVSIAFGFVCGCFAFVVADLHSWICLSL